MNKLGLGALLAIGLGIAGFFVGGLNNSKWSNVIEKSWAVTTRHC